VDGIVVVRRCAKGRDGDNERRESGHGGTGIRLVDLELGMGYNEMQ
jgi:hypothetical protein